MPVVELSCVFVCLCVCVFVSGGLAEEVDEKVLHAAFIPFGDITDIQIPLDYETGESWGCTIPAVQFK